MSNTVKPVLLLILDGFGYSEKTEHNAIYAAKKPVWERLWAQYPHTLIHTSEKRVGLPTGQMGNSEVGHLNIGAGRVVYQELSRVDLAIEDGTLGQNPALAQAIDQAITNNKALHIMGLLSAGGVHSHENHIFALLESAVQKGLKQIYLHAFLDGRDTPPKSAAGSIKAFEDKCLALGAGRIATIVGRFYAMDRDNRWERVQPAYELITQGRAEFCADNAQAGLEQAYLRGETDEFVKTTVIGEPVSMNDGDSVIFMNFRADRAREMTRALTEPDFDDFTRAIIPKLGAYVTLSNYGEDFSHLSSAYSPDVIHNGLGEYLSKLGHKQLRIAETEKYAHVTYFFNGGKEQPYEGEDRILVPSPKVETYDLQPEMSAVEVTDKLEAAILSKKYDAIMCNYANGDMVGHSGVMEAATKAIEVLDVCIGRVVEAMLSIGGEVIITADHGNAEQMEDENTHQPHTAHTLNLVPLIYIGRSAELVDDGALKDIAPSLLAMMGLSQPDEMTGQSLVKFK